MHQFRFAERQGAGLVDGDHIGIAERLERIAAAEQHAHFGGAAGADHDRGRRGKAHGAGTGDDEHRNRIDERKGQGRIGPEHEPDDEGGERCQHHRRHEPVGYLVHQRLDGQLVGLRLLDHADDLGDQRIGADLGGAEGERTVAVDRAADDFGTRRLGDRHRFARYHRFIDIGRAAEDQPIDRYFLAGANDDHIAGAHILQRHIDGFAIAQHAGNRHWPCRSAGFLA